MRAVSPIERLKQEARKTGFDAPLAAFLIPRTSTEERTRMMHAALCGPAGERVREVRPRLHLFGHIHDSAGAWQIDGTLFVNCTTWECSRPATVIEIDEKSVKVSE